VCYILYIIIIICAYIPRFPYIQNHIVMASRHPPTAPCPTKLLFYCFRNNGPETPYSLRVLLVRTRNRSFLSNLLNMLSAGNKNTPLKFHCSSLYFIFANAMLWTENPHLVPTGDREQHNKFRIP